MTLPLPSPTAGALLNPGGPGLFGEPRAHQNGPHLSHDSPSRGPLVQALTLSVP